MAERKTSWTLGEIAELLGGELHGDPAQAVSRPAPADSSDPDSICFVGSKKYFELAMAGQVGALLLSREFTPCHKPHIVVADPRAAFGRLLQLWQRPLPLPEGVHAFACVDPSASVDSTARVGPFAVVERGARIGPRCCVYSFAYVGENCSLGEDSILFPHAVLYQDVVLGARSIVHAGAVLGADGFGFEWDGSRHAKVPQVGGVRTGEDVEIGANSCLDRATSGVTVVGEGVKIDNLVQIGHNVQVGNRTVIAAQTGVSGSTKIGEGVVMGGACATSDHVRIADGARLGGRTGVLSDIDEPGEYWGMPARPLLEAMRASVLVYRLPELMNRIRELERRLERAESLDL